MTEDRSFIGQCAPFTFCSYDCGDNTVSSRTGDTLYVSYDGVDPACLEGMKFDPISAIDFCDGILCIVPPPDDRGDINLNGIANEVADAVLFTNYFIFGPSVWDPIYYENQWLATDVNDDGSTRTVADLVYLIRIITGDAEPFPRSGEGGRLSINDVVSLETRYDNGELVLISDSPVEVGGLFVRLEGAVGSLGEPRYGDDVVELTPRYRVGDDESRLLIAPMKLGAAIPAGRVELARFAVTTPNAIKIAEADAASYQGYPLAVALASGAPGIPQLFELAQNYPNPFNATTMIRLSIPCASDYTLSIYDVTGRKVRQFSGRSEPGIVQVMWDGADERGNPVASGIYLYRATAGEQHSTRKMVLVK